MMKHIINSSIMRCLATSPNAHVDVVDAMGAMDVRPPTIFDDTCMDPGDPVSGGTMLTAFSVLLAAALVAILAAVTIAMCMDAVNKAVPSPSKTNREHNESRSVLKIPEYMKCAMGGE